MLSFHPKKLTPKTRRPAKFHYSVSSVSYTILPLLTTRHLRTKANKNVYSVGWQLRKSVRATCSRDNCLYCADHIANLVQEQWVDTLIHDRKWTDIEDEIDSEKVQVVFFYRKREPIEPLEWRALENRLNSLVKEPPKLELKELLDHLEYAFLQEDDQLPVVISFSLSTHEKDKIIEVLKNHKRAIA
ncbi:hypothetical protein Tco_1227635 [Tanacetum coccineum]